MANKGKVYSDCLFAHQLAANVGADKDSDKRQRQAIEAFAKRAGFELVSEFNDAAVSGADHLETRPGFADCSPTSPAMALAPSLSRPPAGSRAI